MPRLSRVGLPLSAICKAHQFAVRARLVRVDNSEILAAKARMSEMLSHGVRKLTIWVSDQVRHRSTVQQ